MARKVKIMNISARCLISLAVLLSILTLFGCTFWVVRNPRGGVFQVTMSDQELLPFFNRFAAGIEQMFPIFNSLHERYLRRLLIIVNLSFQELCRGIQNSSPSRPINPWDLQQKTLMLAQEIERRVAAEKHYYRRDRLKQALVQAKELQSTIDGFLQVIVDLDP